MSPKPAPFFSVYRKPGGQPLLGKPGTKAQVATDLFWKDAAHWIIFSPRDLNDVKMAHPCCPDCLDLLATMRVWRRAA